jgi:hypothetical protein
MKKLLQFLILVTGGQFDKVGDTRSTDHSNTQRNHCILLLPNNKLCCPKLGTTIYVQFNIICLNFTPAEHL